MAETNSCSSDCLWSDTLSSFESFIPRSVHSPSPSSSPVCSAGASSSASAAGNLEKSLFWDPPDPLLLSSAPTGLSNGMSSSSSYSPPALSLVGPSISLPLAAAAALSASSISSNGGGTSSAASSNPLTASNGSMTANTVPSLASLLLSPSLLSSSLSSLLAAAMPPFNLPFFNAAPSSAVSASSTSLNATPAPVRSPTSMLLQNFSASALLSTPRGSLSIPLQIPLPPLSLTPPSDVESGLIGDVERNNEMDAESFEPTPSSPAATDPADAASVPNSFEPLHTGGGHGHPGRTQQNRTLSHSHRRLRQRSRSQYRQADVIDAEEDGDAEAASAELEEEEALHPSGAPRTAREKEERRRRILAHKAELARNSRRRKKERMCDLENEVARLRSLLADYEALFAQWRKKGQVPDVALPSSNSSSSPSSPSASPRGSSPTAANRAASVSTSTMETQTEPSAASPGIADLKSPPRSSSFSPTAHPQQAKSLSLHKLLPVSSSIPSPSPASAAPAPSKATAPALPRSPFPVSVALPPPPPPPPPPPSNPPTPPPASSQDIFFGLLSLLAEDPTKRLLFASLLSNPPSSPRSPAAPDAKETNKAPAPQSLVASIFGPTLAR